MATVTYQATGRRKTAVATVRLIPGGGKMLVNGKPMRQYLTKDDLMLHVEKPLEVTGMLGKVDLICSARGGGLSGQAGAIRLAIARALVKMNEEFRKALKKARLLTRDPRMVERKKYGQIKARKRFQYSKR
ncbi:MAG: 30S ribosomal protein S9 [candidate division Zixibacteria bacterium]|nr:30S ribosomal protein S9 [candidate division Zixibacteria bacterium]